jgi:hypothetical protein
MTPLGTVSLDFIVTHQSTEDGGHLAWWDAPIHKLPVNRGTIRITPLAADRTLLVYTVVKRWRIYPQSELPLLSDSHPLQQPRDDGFHGG